MNAVKSIVTGVFCVAAGAVAVADELPLVIYVTNGNANAQSPYTTRETAAPNLKTALAAAKDGDEIVLLKSKDAYKTTEQLLINKAIVVHGETGNPEDVVIDAQNKCRNVKIDHPQALLHSVVLANGLLREDQGSNLRIYANGGTASNCVIRGGYVEGYWSSAAAYLESSYALLTHSVVTNNVTGSAGNDKTAGVQLGKGAKASNCLIADNHERAMSGLSCTGGAYVPNGTLENCTIVRNSARNCGGVRTSSNSTVKNCVIVGNVSDWKGARYNNVDPAQKAMFDHCACDDVEKLNDTCVRDAPANLFAGYANGDYTIAPGSVLIDAGADVSDPPALDLANFTRVMGTIDIGAYEYDTSKLSLGLKTDVNEAVVPVTVTFEASLSGVSKDDVCEYVWDFDGDGTVDLTTSTNKVQHTFAQGGRYSPILTVEDMTAGKSATQDFPNLLYLMPKTIYVVSNNPGVAFPYGSFATAATTLSEALSAAIDGIEVVLSNGTHTVTTQILVDKTLDIHGYESDPARTVVKYTGVNYPEPSFRNTRAGTFIHDLTFDGAAANRPGWNLEGYGVISNCIIRGMKNYDHWGRIGAVSAAGKNTLVTHCVITNNETTTRGVDSKAIVTATGGARIENCLIARNKDTVGTPMARGSAGAFVNCTVVSNELSTSTVLTDEGALGVTNCIFAANVRTGSGSDFSFTTDVPTACNRNLADTKVAGWLYEPDAAKIFADPAAQDWHLSVSSPARDCGVRRMNLPATDLDGNPRKVGRVDLGCYENPVGNGTLLLVR